MKNTYRRESFTKDEGCTDYNSILAKREEKTSFPIFALRLGNMNTAFFHGSIGDDYVHGIYRYQAKLKLGVNLTPNAHLNQHFSLGYTFRNQVVLEGDFNLNQHLTLKPSIYLKHKPNYGLGIRYTPNPNKQIK